MDDDQTSGQTSVETSVETKGKAERDPAEETGEQGVPAGQDQDQEQGQDAAPTETGAEPAPPVQPPAMTPLEVASAGPAAAVRVYCDGRCRQEWCLYAGPDVPADPDGAPYPDPREAVMAAAGCHADPPTCPGALDTLATSTPPGGVATSPEARAAVADVARTLQDSIAAGLPSGISSDVIHPLRARRHPSALAGGLDVGVELTAATVGGPTPLLLTSAEAHGITGSGRPAPAVLASGQDVSLVLQMLGVDTSSSETAVVHRPETPPADEEVDRGAEADT